MIKIEYVKFKNFLCFGAKTQEVQLNCGINVITGSDLDKERSNGSGKTSLLETIQYALYGQINRDLRKDQIINWKNRRECLVELGFSKDENTYKVVRGEKPSIFDIYKNNEILPKPSHAKYHQETLENIIGLDFQTFSSVIHTNINSSKPLLEMTKPEKRAFLEKMFDLEKYSKLNALCNSKLHSINELIRENSANISNNKNLIDRTNVSIEDLKSKIQILEKDISTAKDTIKSLEKKDTEISDEVKSDLKNIQTSVVNVSSKIKEVSHKIKFIQCESKEIPKHIEPKDVVEEKINNIDTKLNKISEETNERTEQIIKTTTEKRNLESNLIELKKEKDLVNKGVCPTCNQRIEDDTVLKVNNKYESLQKNLIKITTKEKELLSLSKAVKQTQDDLTEEKRNLSNILDYIENKAQLDRKKRLVKAKEKLEQLLYNYEKKKDKLESIVDEKRQVKSKIEVAKEKIKEKGSTKKEFTLMLNHAIVDVENSKKNNEELEKKHDRLNGIKDYLNYIKDLCSDEKIKSYVISNTMPFLCQRVNYYLSQTNFGFYVSIDNFLETEIKGPGISNASYKNLSGGERRGIDLALQFAFLDIVKRKAKELPDILILDEILDSSIDSVGISKLMEIIKTKQRDDNLKIFIISHREDISNESNIDSMYIVKKSNGFSKIYNLWGTE